MLEEKNNDFFYKAAQWCLLALAALLPIWYWPNTVSPVEFNKVLLVSILTIISFLLYLAHSVIVGRIKILPLKILGVGLVMLASWLVSALITRSSSALWGTGSETTSFLAILVFLILIYLVAVLFDERESLRKLFGALISGMSLATLISFFSAIGWMRWLGGAFADPTFNAIGSWNSLALALGFFIFLIYPFLISAKGIWRWIFGALLFFSLVEMLFVNFPLAWIISGFFALLLLSYAIWRRNVSPAVLGLPMLIILFAIYGFFSSQQVIKFVSDTLNIRVPVEVVVNNSATFNIVKESLGKNLFFGNGPTTFGYLWDLYKPLASNATPFWNVRFGVGSSYILSALAEVGLLAWALLIIFLLVAWKSGSRAVSYGTSPDFSPMALSSFLASSYLILVLALYPAAFTLVSLAFLLVGMTLASSRFLEVLEGGEATLFGEGTRGLVSAIAVVILIVASFSGVYIVSSRYIGQVVFAEGVDFFNNQGNIDKAEQDLILATKSDTRNDIYYRALTQLYMTRAQLLFQDNATPRELLGSKFKDALDNAVAAGQQAVRLGPQDSANYRAVGKIYEFLVPLNTQGAADAALLQYDEAIKRAPASPLIWRDKAGVYLAEVVASKNRAFLKNAEDALLKSTELKPDYTEGHFLLAQVYDAEGNLNDAIKRSEAAAILSPNDIGSLFQLGLLYYKASRFQDAQVILERAVSINKDYANAMYFLGLIYERAGRKGDAIAEFQKIQILNPGNDEVKKILANLQGGRSALAGIVPPAAPPEKRSAPPLSENQDNSSLKPSPKQ